MKIVFASDFLAAVALLNGFKPKPMIAAQAELLAKAARFNSVMASDLAGDFGRHVPGAACGALRTINLLEPIGRVKSPDPKAKGRRLDVWRIPAGRFGAVKAWFAANGVEVKLTNEQQIEILIA